MISGIIRGTAQHPSRPDTVYVLTAGGGLWRADDLSSPKAIMATSHRRRSSTHPGAFAQGCNPSKVCLGIGDWFSQVAQLGASAAAE